MRTSAAILLLVASLVSQISAAPFPPHTVGLAQLYDDREDQRLARRTLTIGLHRLPVGDSQPPASVNGAANGAAANVAPAPAGPPAPVAALEAVAAPAAKDPKGAAIITGLTKLNQDSYVKLPAYKKQVIQLAEQGHLVATSDQALKSAQQGQIWDWVAKNWNSGKNIQAFSANEIKSMMAKAMEGGFNPTDDLLKTLQLSLDDLPKVITKVV
ncbi:hypothetical protein FRB99_004991 [Tulasnella sp. 403]|nr:hypothetical protein FRB99_004991 [Tulasnella sp. 403]